MSRSSARSMSTDSDATAIESAILECIEEGCNIIFATSWGYMDTCEALAEEYPNVIFSHGTGYKSNGKNFNNYFGRIYQARYLSGIAAGLKTKTNKIGYVAAWGSENGEVTSGCDAFAMGVYSVNPDCRSLCKGHQQLVRSGRRRPGSARRLSTSGCDVIGQHCDTAEPAARCGRSRRFRCRLQLRHEQGCAEGGSDLL